MEPVLYDSRNLIEELNVNYIYVSKRKWSSQYHLKTEYLEKSALYELNFYNKYVYIFSIV